MPRKFDPAAVTAARDEYRKIKKTDNGADAGPAVVSEKPAPPAAVVSDPSPVSPGVETGAGNSAPGPDQQQAQQAAPSPGVNIPPPPPNEFREKLKEYFKDSPFLTGSFIVEAIDDLKTNAFYIYCKKNKIDIEKGALKMDQKTKDLSAAFINHASQDQILNWVEKHPIAGAGIVMGLSAGTTFLFLQAMKSTNDEKEKLQKELEALRREKHETEKGNAETVDAEVIPITDKGSGIGEFREKIQSL